MIEKIFVKKKKKVVGILRRINRIVYRVEVRLQLGDRNN